ncbi:hypothetical protein ACFYU5_35985 [Nocardia aobensis]|uniref:Transposase IS111A/IS1328/IS1533 N-terminal domain-containing protein n=1 Tax=Nocardia aobensis TaxID=257277 RepID=A0ABW6PF66_9NOCA
MMVTALCPSLRLVFAINPMAVARCRERDSVARAKSDHADAMTLANILRAGAHLHGVLPADSELAPSYGGSRTPQMRQPGPVKQAMGRQALALLDDACTGADDLEQAAAEEFRKHPDYAVITSFSGLADLTGSRTLAEIGDDRRRFADASVEGLRRIRSGHESLGQDHLHQPQAVQGATAWRRSVGPGAPPWSFCPGPANSTTGADATTATVTHPRSCTCSKDARPALLLPANPSALRPGESIRRFSS